MLTGLNKVRRKNFADNPRGQRTHRRTVHTDDRLGLLGAFRPCATRRSLRRRTGLPATPALAACLATPDDTHSRYIEARVNGLLIGCLYLPNGNPAPGPKFDYKLAWFERLKRHAAELLTTGAPVVLAGDYNVIPTDLDVYKPERWVDDALFRPESRQAFAELVGQGWVDAIRTLHPGEHIYTFWDYFRNAWSRNAGLRIDHLLLSPAIAGQLLAAGVDRDVRGWERASDHAPTWVELREIAADLTVGQSRRRARRNTGQRSP